MLETDGMDLTGFFVSEMVLSASLRARARSSALFWWGLSAFLLRMRVNEYVGIKAALCGVSDVCGTRSSSLDLL